MIEKERLGLSDDEFWNMTPYKFWLKQKGNIEGYKITARPFAVLSQIVGGFLGIKEPFTPNQMLMLKEEETIVTEQELDEMFK